jgi:hypothetical protein
MVDLQRGDLIFYLQDNELISEAISLMEKVFHETGGVKDRQFVHVAIVSDTYGEINARLPGPLFRKLVQSPAVPVPSTRMLIEMVWPHPKIRPAEDGRPRVVVRLNCDPVVTAKMIVWAENHALDHYSLPDYLFAHLGIGSTDRFCSQYARMACDAAGFPIVDPAVTMVDPDECEVAAEAHGKRLDA